MNADVQLPHQPTSLPKDSRRQGMLRGSAFRRAIYSMPPELLIFIFLFKDFPDRSIRSPMEGARPVFQQSGEMSSCHVAFVSIEPILWEKAMTFHHRLISINLGYNGS